MNPALTFQSPRAERLILRLKHEFLAAAADGRGDLEPKDLALALHMSRRNISQYLQYLKENKQIHIGSWRRRERWGPVRCYRLGPGGDAPRPKPYTGAELCRRHRAANPERVVKDIMGKRIKRVKPHRDPLTSALFGPIT